MPQRAAPGASPRTARCRPAFRRTASFNRQQTLPSPASGRPSEKSRLMGQGRLRKMSLSTVAIDSSSTRRAPREVALRPVRRCSCRRSRSSPHSLLDESQQGVIRIPQSSRQAGAQPKRWDSETFHQECPDDCLGPERRRERTTLLVPCRERAGRPRLHALDVGRP